jgi:hypothetical protein
MRKKRVCLTLSDDALAKLKEIQDYQRFTEQLKLSQSMIVERAILTLHKQLVK